ncbi:MAG: hypothetical protein KKA84_12885 [Bacteroidetes bacterium]|nr:hypothetical protein [Bacteroidota bacterium]
MELNDIIYNVLLLVGFFALGFVAIGMIFSRNQRKAFEDRLENIHPTIHQDDLIRDRNMHRSAVGDTFQNVHQAYQSLDSSVAINLDRSFSSYTENSYSNSSSIYKFR